MDKDIIIKSLLVICTWECFIKPSIYKLFELFVEFLEKKYER